jgi:hypothetical protein
MSTSATANPSRMSLRAMTAILPRAAPVATAATPLPGWLGARNGGGTQWHAAWVSASVRPRKA